MSKARSFASAACALVLAAAFAAGSGADGTVTNPKHIFWAPGQDPTGTVASVTNDIIYHGGNVGPGAIGIEKTPAVYLVYWGPAWVTGFDTVDANGQVFSSKSLQNYLNSFFQNVGGSPWAAVQTQYCRNVPAGTTSCAGIPGADFVTNPKHQVKGVWTDPTPVWDGYSIVVGHEYSEAVTDPDNVTSIQDGWNDDQTSENADKCAWYHTQNITLAGHQYAIQPTWSNEAFDAGKDGCAVAR